MPKKIEPERAALIGDINDCGSTLSYSNKKPFGELLKESFLSKQSVGADSAAFDVSLNDTADKTPFFGGKSIKRPSPSFLQVHRDELLFGEQPNMEDDDLNKQNTAQYGQNVDIIGVNMDKGASKSGCGLGAEAIFQAGLFGVLSALGAKPRNCGIVSADETDISATLKDSNENFAQRLNNLSEVNAVGSLLYAKVLDTLRANRFPMIFGGDHSLAAASGSAFITHFSKVGIIWVDAHGDFNNAFSSPSGNIHGMPLSALTGGGPNEILPFLDKSIGFIHPHNAVLIGARDLDEIEQQRIKEAGVTHITMQEIHEHGIKAATNKALAIAGAGTNGVYLSFDLDGLDSSVLGGLGTPVKDGLSMDDGITLCQIVAASGQILGAEIVEYNPTLDPEKTGARKAICLAQNIITHLKENKV